MVAVSDKIKNSEKFKVCLGWLMDGSIDINASNVSYTAADLLSRAQNSILQCEYELAMSFAQRALEMDRSFPNVLETCAQISLELQRFDDAYNVILAVYNYG